MIGSKEIKKDIYWVGSLDKDIKVFDIVMTTEYGTTYNAYVYKTSEKTILIEVSKEGFFDEFISRVKEVADPTKLDYVVVNHTEPDHAGSIANILKLNPNITVVGTNSAIRNIKNITNMDFKSLAVKDSDTLDIGDGKVLKFIQAPFLHWPDTMFTYSPSDKVIFTCDFLGAHYCSDKIFNDDFINDKTYDECFKYYFDCIMGPFKPYVLSALKKIENLDFDTVCTGHGLILRSNISKYTDLYKKWSTKPAKDKPKVILTYVSSYGYTKKMADKIYEGLVDSNKADVKYVELTSCNMSELIHEIETTADALLIGSPTIVADTLPPVWELLTSLNPYINKGLTAAAFGSYGWSGEAITNIDTRFKQLGFKIPLEPLKVVLNPSDDDLEKAYNFGLDFAINL